MSLNPLEIDLLELDHIKLNTLDPTLNTLDNPPPLEASEVAGDGIFRTNPVGVGLYGIGPSTIKHSIFNPVEAIGDPL